MAQKITVTEVKRDRLGGRTEMVVCTGTPAASGDWVDAHDLGLGTVYTAFVNGLTSTSPHPGVIVSTTTPYWVVATEGRAGRFTIIGESRESTGGD